MSHVIRVIGLSVFLAMSAGCVSAEPRAAGHLSKLQIETLLGQAQIHDPWKVEQEHVSDNETPWVVFVTVKPVPLQSSACVARELIMRVASDGRTVKAREEKSTIAFRSCDRASIDDFRAVDVFSEVDLSLLPFLARLLREASTCSEGRCVSRDVVKYERDDLQGIFAKIKMSDLLHITADSPDRVRFTFIAKALTPEMLSCEFQRKGNGVWSLYVYRENGPDPAAMN